MTLQQAIEEIQKCRGNAEAKKIAVKCMQYILGLQKHAENDLLEEMVNTDFTQSSQFLHTSSHKN